jgi:hypothetical protein
MRGGIEGREQRREGRREGRGEEREWEQDGDEILTWCVGDLRISCLTSSTECPIQLEDLSRNLFMKVGESEREKREEGDKNENLILFAY